MNRVPWVLGSLAAAAQASDDPQLALWALILIGVAVVLFFLEVVVPSGGVIGALSAVSLIAGIVMLFRVNTVLGLIGAIVSLLSVPFLFAVAVKLWPHTPIAQMLLLKNVHAVRRHGTDPAGGQELIGTGGQALTDLRPVGTCLIGGQRRSCLAENGLISRGSHVRVVSVSGPELTVRLADP